MKNWDVEVTVLIVLTAFVAIKTVADYWTDIQVWIFTGAFR